MPNTPNIGLGEPQGGVTAGAANNTTPGTYPYIWQANLLLIDTYCLSIPNNPAKVSNGGIVIDGNLNFGGFGITNASTGAFSSNLTIGGTLGVTGISTLTGGIGTSLTIGTSLVNQVTITGKATGTDPTITVAGDATRNMQIIYPTASSSSLAYVSFSPTNGAPVAVGNVGSGYSAIWLGTALGSITASNYALSSNGTGTVIIGQTVINFDIGLTTYLSMSGSALGINGIPFQQGTAATALTLKGNAAATAGIGTILDNQTTQTSGTITSFRTGGTEKAVVTFSGGFTSDSGTFASGTVGTGLILGSQAASGGDLLTVFPASVDVGGTGSLLKLQSLSGTNQFVITGRGHLIPLSTAPTAPNAGNFAAGFFATGVVSGITLTGSDACMILKFTTGTSCTQITEQTSLIGTITLSQAYSSSSFGGFAAFASEPTNVSLSYGVNDTAPLILVPLSAVSFALYAAIPFTPKLSTTYAITIFTVGAGAVY
jgi:hypothetical protein